MPRLWSSFLRLLRCCCRRNLCISLLAPEMTGRRGGYRHVASLRRGTATAAVQRASFESTCTQPKVPQQSSGVRRPLARGRGLTPRQLWNTLRRRRRQARLSNAVPASWWGGERKAARCAAICAWHCTPLMWRKCCRTCSPFAAPDRRKFTQCAGATRYFDSHHSGIDGVGVTASDGLDGLAECMRRSTTLCSHAARSLTQESVKRFPDKPVIVGMHSCDDRRLCGVLIGDCLAGKPRQNVANERPGPPCTAGFCPVAARRPKPHRMLTHDSTCAFATLTHKEGVEAPGSCKSTDAQTSTHTIKHARDPVIKTPRQLGGQSPAGIPGLAELPAVPLQFNT
jgi:hypothetical protein